MLEYCHMSKILSINKKASFDYEFIKKYEVGLVLLGNEVKSIKTRKASLKGAFVNIYQNELFLVNCNIPYYQNHSFIKYENSRNRKLLIHRKELDSLINHKSSGLTIIPIKLYLKRGLIKLEIALAKGKKSFDKRHSIREREESRDIKRSLKNN